MLHYQYPSERQTQKFRQAKTTEDAILNKRNIASMNEIEESIIQLLKVQFLDFTRIKSTTTKPTPSPPSN